MSDASEFGRIRVRVRVWAQALSGRGASREHVCATIQQGHIMQHRTSWHRRLWVGSDFMRNLLSRLEALERLGASCGADKAYTWGDLSDYRGEQHQNGENGVAYLHRRRRSRRGGRAIITQGHTETAALGAYVPYTLDRKNRQSDIPDRASLPRKRTRNAPREKKKRRG